MIFYLEWNEYETRRIASRMTCDYELQGTNGPLAYISCADEDEWSWELYMPTDIDGKFRFFEGEASSAIEAKYICEKRLQEAGIKKAPSHLRAMI